MQTSWLPESERNFPSLHRTYGDGLRQTTGGFVLLQTIIIINKKSKQHEIKYENTCLSFTISSLDQKTRIRTHQTVQHQSLWYYDYFFFITFLSTFSSVYVHSAKVLLGNDCPKGERCFTKKAKLTGIVCWNGNSPQGKDCRQV